MSGFKGTRARDFLISTSPNDKYGLRADLQKHLLRGMVENEMEKYAELRIKESKAPDMLEMLEKIALVFEMFNPPSKETALEWSKEINELIKDATEL